MVIGGPEVTELALQMFLPDLALCEFICFTLLLTIPDLYFHR